jgi:hypothetical protein
MTSRTALPDLLRLAAALPALAMAACGGGYTVHPVVDESNALTAVEGLEGIWIAGDGDDYWAMQIAAVPVASRTCQEAAMRVWEESSSLDEPPMLEGRFCLTEIAGRTVAELGTASEPLLYQHFLVRIERSRIAVCGGVSVWATFKDSADGDTPVYSMEGLEYTVRRRGETEDVFIISDPDDLRAYLARNLPRLADQCDANNQDDSGPAWVVFERVTPSPEKEAPTESGPPGQPSSVD